jgi:hypothetical protein
MILLSWLSLDKCFGISNFIRMALQAQPELEARTTCVEKIRSSVLKIFKNYWKLLLHEKVTAPQRC